MPGILSRFSRDKRPSVAQLHELTITSLRMYREGATREEVHAALVAAGAPEGDAARIVAETKQRTDQELVRSVALPASAQEDFNYYFVLGVTPTASTEQIKRAYRRKAMIVHPDQHHFDFSKESWARLMTLMGDAHSVLTNPLSRRAYDVVWRARSVRVAAANRRRGENRGDWETRYRWEMASLAEDEELISEALEDVRTGVDSAGVPIGAADAIALAVDKYESEILEIRNQTHGLPPAFLRFGDLVRYEMQRKERMVPSLRKLIDSLAHGDAEAVKRQLAVAEKALETVREAQDNFEVVSTRLSDLARPLPPPPPPDSRT